LKARDPELDDNDDHHGKSIMMHDERNKNGSSAATCLICARKKILAGPAIKPILLKQHGQDCKKVAPVLTLPELVHVAGLPLLVAGT
jgi:hypothetical protein